MRTVSLTNYFTKRWIYEALTKRAYWWNIQLIGLLFCKIGYSIHSAIWEKASFSSYSTYSFSVEGKSRAHRNAEFFWDPWKKWQISLVANGSYLWFIEILSEAVLWRGGSALVSHIHECTVQEFSPLFKSFLTIRTQLMVVKFHI